MMRMIFLILIIFIGACNTLENSFTAEDYEKFGRQIEYAVKRNKIGFIKNKFQLAPIYDSLLRELKINEVDVKEYQKGSSVKKKLLLDHFTSYLNVFQNIVGNNGQFKFIKYYQDENAHVLFGLINNGYRDFVDFKLITSGDKIYIQDLFFYNTSIRLSENFITDEVNKRVYGWLGGPYIQALEELYNAKVYLDRQQPERALKAFNRIPEEFAYNGHFHPLKLQIAAQISDSLLMETYLERVGFNWEENRTRYLNGIEYHNRFGEPEIASKYLDSLISITGKNFVTEDIFATSKQ